MTIKTKISGATFHGSLLAFFSFVVYILYVNQEVLYTAHDRSEFMLGAPFFHALIQKPFGLIQYVGAWLTQLFFHPSLGAGVLVSIWALIFYVGAKAFRIQGKATSWQQDVGNSVSALMLLPIACLLTSIVDLGYWIYVLPIRGYWFSQSIGYLVMLLLLWAARSTPRKWHLVWYLLAFCIYPVLGWFALLFILCLVLSEKPTWRELLGILLLLFSASIWHSQLYSNQKFDNVILAGLPRFITASGISKQLTIPFWVLGAVSALMPLCSRFLVKARATIKWLIPVSCAIAGIIFTYSLMFQNRNYTDEMRMVRYASNDNWKEVLNIAEENKKPTTTMVFLKNIALINEGGLLERSFKMGNISEDLCNPDSLHVSFLNIASPLAYYNYGMINEATRLNFELAIQYGFSPFYLKMLSRCAQAQGEKKLEKRYNTLLRHHPFYRDWQPALISSKVKELKDSYPDEITGVENSDSYIVNSICLWNRTNNKLASEQALLYSMLRCDSHYFWPALRNYVRLHMNETFPVHAQEAYILFIDKFPEEKRIMLPVEETVYNRYKQFCETLAKLVKPGKTLGKVAEDMRKEWEDTYWYYYFFGRQYTNIVSQKDHEIPS